MTIVVGSLQHETNTFSPIKPKFEDFDFVAGAGMLDRIAATSVFRRSGVDLIPTIYANALPSGSLSSQSFFRFVDLILEPLPRHRRIDGVWLYLHGAMEVDGVGSGEVELLRRLRAEIGNRVPVALALDFHANLPTAMADLANVICGYRTAPHVDMEETQQRAARMLLECIGSRSLPRPVIVPVPMLITGDKVITEAEPARSVMGEVRAAEKREGVLCASLFNGQPWVDAPNAGASVAITPTGNPAVARSEALRLATLLWSVRERFDFEVEAYEPEEALAAAAGSSERPVFVTDSGDNTTAGAAGDSASLLRMILDGGLVGFLVAGISDPEAVQRCAAFEPGTTVELRIGGRLDPPRSESVNVVAVVKRTGRMLGWYGEDAGACAVIGVGGVDVVVTERRCAFISPEIFANIGLDVTRYNVVVVKLGYLFPRLRDVARRSILALTDGASCEHIDKLRFARIRRPIYPVDREFSWDAEAAIG